MAGALYLYYWQGSAVPSSGVFRTITLLGAYDQPVALRGAYDRPITLTGG